MVELSQLSPEQKAELAAQAIAELSGTNLPAELAALIQTKASEIAAVQLAAEQRKAHIAEFAAQARGGEGKTKGLPIPQDELVTFLSSLNDEQREAAEGMLTRIVEAGGLVDFQEHGHGGAVQGTAQLDPIMAGYLRQWLAVPGNTIDGWFAVCSHELGDMSDYNLSEFAKEK